MYLFFVRPSPSEFTTSLNSVFECKRTCSTYSKSKQSKIAKYFPVNTNTYYLENDSDIFFIIQLKYKNACYIIFLA